MKIENKFRKLSYIIISLLVICLIASTSGTAFAAKKKASRGGTKGKHSKVVSSKSRSSKSRSSRSKSSKSRHSRKRASKYNVSESAGPVSKQFVSKLVDEQVLGPGVIYQNLMVGYGKKLHSIHVLEADMTNPDCSVAVMKANNHNTELERLTKIVRDYDSTSGNVVAGAVNANFWSAYNNYPIGPTMINGELIEMKTHKNWSSTLFDSTGKAYIDNFFISGSVRNKRSRRIFEITSINKRKDSSGVIIYNKYYGDTIPFVSRQRLAKSFADALNRASEEYYNDSTEAAIDTNTLKNEIRNAERSAELEYSFPKFSLVYLDKPAVNKNVRCVVVSADTGMAVVPRHGCVLSLGSSISKKDFPLVGDTLLLGFYTNVNDEIEFTQAVSGTPRLVRDGVASHEASDEGSGGKRFLNQNLPRTAIGTDKSKTRLFIVTVECNGKEQIGANLRQWADIMNFVGASDAMNLDGGGSSMMVINGKNVMNQINPYGGRRISVGLAIVNTKKSISVQKGKALDPKG